MLLFYGLCHPGAICTEMTGVAQWSYLLSELQILQQIMGYHMKYKPVEEHFLIATLIFYRMIDLK